MAKPGQRRSLSKDLKSKKLSVMVLHRTKDAILVDHLKIQVANAVGDAPDGDPSGLSALAISFDQVDLFWVDGSTNEVGFRIERSENGGGCPTSWARQQRRSPKDA